MSRYRFIAAEKAQYSVAQLSRVLQVAPSSYYAWRHRKPSPRALANAMLTEQIRAIHRRSRCTYGAPRVHADLRAQKKRVSRKRVARLMRVAGLAGRPPRRFRRTTVGDPKTQVQDLVQRQFTAAAPDKKWFGDITYIRTWEGWQNVGCGACHASACRGKGMRIKEARRREGKVTATPGNHVRIGHVPGLRARVDVGHG